MPSELGTWLRRQRQARGWNIPAMAGRLREAGHGAGDAAVPPAKALRTYIRRWENGQVHPSERYKLYYCRTLNIPVDAYGQHPLPDGTPVAGQPVPAAPAAPARPLVPTEPTEPTEPAGPAQPTGPAGPAVPGRAGEAPRAGRRPASAGECSRPAVAAAIAALTEEYCRQVELLLTLHADYPGHEFWLEPRIPARPLLVGRRKPGHGGGARLILTTGPDEMRRALGTPAAG